MHTHKYVHTLLFPLFSSARGHKHLPWDSWYCRPSPFLDPSKHRVTPGGSSGFPASELGCSEAVVTSNEDIEINFVLTSELSAWNVIHLQISSVCHLFMPHSPRFLLFAQPNIVIAARMTDSLGFVILEDVWCTYHLLRIWDCLQLEEQLFVFRVYVMFILVFVLLNMSEL